MLTEQIFKIQPTNMKNEGLQVKLSRQLSTVSGQLRKKVAMHILGLKKI